MKRKAFTLVELMVVIAILAILAALMYPVLNKVREKGRMIQCANNLKELHTAAMQYVGNSGRFPYSTTFRQLDPVDRLYHEYIGWVGPATKLGTSASSTAGAMDMFDTSSAGGPASSCITNGSLYGYITDKKIFLCPTFRLQAESFNKKFPVRSYVMSAAMSDYSIYSLTNGTKRLLFSEENVGISWEGTNVTTVYATMTAASASYPADTANYRYYYLPKHLDGNMHYTANLEAIAAYHTGKGQGVFADGHIETLVYSNTAAVCTGAW